MTSQLNFRVILSVIAEKTAQEKEALACILAASFDVPGQEALAIFDRLPVVIFDDISGENLKTIKDQLIFLSKLGLDFNITFKPFPELYRTKWQIKASAPVVSCPGCGEQFILLRADDFHRHVARKEEQKTPLQATSHATPILSPTSSSTNYGEPAQELSHAGSISAEMEEVDVLSEELEAIVRREETIDNEVEEVESISEEMKRIGNNSSIEGIGGISAEFEEIEGVSAEFEKMCMGSMDTDIGSLSAELEEIEDLSGELTSLESDSGIEKIHEPLQKIGGAGGILKNEDSSDYELEELSEMSTGLEKIAEPLDEDLLTNLMDSEVLDSEDSPLKRPGSHLTGKKAPATPRKRPETQRATKKAPIKPKSAQKKQTTNPVSGQPIKFPSGDYNVMINFSGRGNIQGGNQLLGTIKGVPVEEIKKLTERHAAIVVANDISLDAAKKIVEQFQKLKLQGRIVPNRKK